jgi:hypothetical protein
MPVAMQQKAARPTIAIKHGQLAQRVAKQA